MAMSSTPNKNLLQIPDPPESSVTEESTSPSWVPSWFPTSPSRSSLRDRDKVHKKNTSVGFEEKGDNVPVARPVRRNRSLGAAETSQKQPVLSTLSQTTNDLSHVIINMDGSGDAAHTQTVIVVEEPKEVKETRRKTKPAPPAPSARLQQSVRSNFSYDTLKERADVWKKERSKRPGRSMRDAEVDETPMKEFVRDRSRFIPETPGSSSEDTQRPKICFTKEESDKVDKDILRLMDALEHNKYPFNRDKHVIFNKLRLIRRKQMGLLFAHKELDNTGYLMTDKEDFGFDVVADKLGVMYNVIDAISRDVYELREMLYYERRNQTPPRRGSTERRSSSTPAYRESDQNGKTARERRASRPANLPVPRSTKPSPNRGLVATDVTSPTKTKPILKHSMSSDSFKSAKSEDTVTP